MSRLLYAAVIEDDKGQHHQFHAFSESELNKLVADWTRARWKDIFGKCPADDGECIEVYFDWQSTYADPGFAHEIWSLDPIELDPMPAAVDVAMLSRHDRPKHGCDAQAVLPTDWRLHACDQANAEDFLLDWGPETEMRKCLERETTHGRDVWLTDPAGNKHHWGLETSQPSGRLQATVFEAGGNAHYPMELYVNGELSFKLDSEDAEGDLKAIRALMEFRTRTRQNKPLTNRELYGVDDPDITIHTSSGGQTVRTKPGDPMCLYLLPSTAVKDGAAMLKVLRSGQSPATSSLEALDEVLLALTPEEEKTVQVVSSKGPMPIEMVKRLRFQRGFDIRPKTSPCAAEGEQPT